MHPENAALLLQGICFTCSEPIGKGHMCPTCIRLRKAKDDAIRVGMEAAAWNARESNYLGWEL
jgi:hypothetical protein